MMILGDPRPEIEERGYFTVCEPAVGAGVTIIALAEAVREASANPQTDMHVTAVDLDATAVHMAYIHFTLLHLPAIILHGNTITLELFDTWVTPAHIMGGWRFRLNRNGDETEHGLITLRSIQEATHVAQEPAHADEVRAPSPVPRVMPAAAAIMEQLDLFS
jgi:hypothetical protein